MGKGKKNGKGIKMDLSPSPFTSPTYENRNHFNFGDVSKEQKAPIDEEGILDSKLSSLGLIRKKIPKDGACLFRAVADQLLSTQTFHYQVRQRCVETIFMNKDFYLPFISVSNSLTGQSVRFEDYIDCMRKVDTWGGQIECHAISLYYNACLVIHNINSSIPTTINPPSQTEEKTSFQISRSNYYPSKTPEIHLCYYNNHYDTVVSNQYHQREIYCQQLIYSIINKIFDEDEDFLFKTVDRHKRKQEKNSEDEEPETIEWKNIGWECWIREGRDQERKDQELAQNITQDRPSEQAWSSPYQRKKGNQQSQNTTPIKSSPKPNPSQSTPKATEEPAPKPAPSFSSENEFFPTLMSTTPKKVQQPSDSTNQKWESKNWGQILTQPPPKSGESKDSTKPKRPVRKVEVFCPNGRINSPVQYIKNNFLQLNLSEDSPSLHQFGFFPHNQDIEDTTKHTQKDVLQTQQLQHDAVNHLYSQPNMNFIHPKATFMVPHYFPPHIMVPFPGNPSMMYPPQPVHTHYPPPAYFYSNAHFGHLSPPPLKFDE